MLAGEVHHFLFCFFSNTNQLMVALCEGSDSEEEGEELAGAERVPGLGFSVACVSARRAALPGPFWFSGACNAHLIPARPG